jgi:predicted nucleic acid-binding protein
VEIYDAVYLAHTLHLHALSLREFVWRLRGAGLIGQRPVEMARFALRRAEALRRSSLDLRLLHPTQVQYSINLSMRRLTLIGALALPRPLDN